MRNAILVHGRPDKDEYYDPKYPSASNSHWFPWLTKQLQINDIFATAIEVPEPWKPRYDIWKKELERFDISSETILVGHSCGGGFIVRWLSENKDRDVNKVILVAPWINPDNNPKSDTADFFDFAIDSDIINRTKGITVFISDNDKLSVRKSAQIIKEGVVGIKYKEFHNYGHFCYSDLKTDAFPELLEEILNL